MKTIRFALCILLTAFIWTVVVGCATSAPDPLTGWKPAGEIGFKVGEMQTHIETFPGDKSISDDVQDFIDKLPIDGTRRICYWIDHMTFFEDDAGQHAVKIEIPWNGTYWKYVLLYNKDDKRIKTIRYSAGHYAS